ncbi:hypothetical protein FNYG_08794 [Fusarium nygamai]|uniref:Uncharacterized protein n=1 Tax=Gibberella nygamai TaxID=42673 RepID=A0A2K0W615_GIBNY|nr:hypothetical protein FNYG_08794 [Fusarium nygamai]
MLQSKIKQTPQQLPSRLPESLEVTDLQEWRSPIPTQNAFAICPLSQGSNCAPTSRRTQHPESSAPLSIPSPPLSYRPLRRGHGQESLSGCVIKCGRARIQVERPCYGAIQSPFRATFDANRKSLLDRYKSFISMYSSRSSAAAPATQPATSRYLGSAVQE